MSDYQTLKAAAPTPEELERRVLEELRALNESGAGMRLELHPAAAFAIVAFCQLALRHPNAAEFDSAANVTRFIEYVRAKFEPHAPAIALAIERGNSPEHDRPREPEPPESIPPYCVSCGAPLEGGATVHRPGCTIRALIEKNFPGYQVNWSDLDKTINTLIPQPEHDRPRQAPRTPEPAGEIPPEAFGGRKPADYELRFYRLIEEHTQSEDGIHDYKLGCGHSVAFPARLPEAQEYAYCLTCLHAWIERSRQARENIIPEPEAPRYRHIDGGMRPGDRVKFENPRPVPPRVIEQEAKFEDGGISIRFRPNEPYRDLTPAPAGPIAQPEPPEMEEERALLRRLLNSRDPLENARLVFRHEKHRMVFQRIMDLHERGEPVERVALANELMKNGELQAVGGLTYLVTLYAPPPPEPPRQATRDPYDGFLNCPYCGFSQPAPLEKVDLYICGACGRTVDGGAPV